MIMDLLKALKINETIKNLLFKYLVHNNVFEAWIDDNEFDFSLTDIDIVGYSYEGSEIKVAVIYEDKCSDTGYGIEVFSIDFDKFSTYLEKFETKIEEFIK